MATNKKLFAFALKKLTPLYERLKKRPEKVLGFLLLVLLLALVLNLAQYKYFPSSQEREKEDLSIFTVKHYPADYGKRKKMQQKREKLRPQVSYTIRSLQSYLAKEKKGELTKADSLEMDRLYTQFKILMHAYESDSL